MNEDNKKIAENSIYTIFRLIVTIVVGLCMSRLSLQILGVSDYGLYNVVAGILIFFSFFLQYFPTECCFEIFEFRDGEG